MLIGLGSNYFGQLGLGGKKRDNGSHTPTSFGCPEEDDPLDATSIADVQCGSQFTSVLLKDGSLQLTGTLNGSVYPSLTKVHITIPLHCKQVSCGRRHVLLLMERGIVMSYGIGYFGQLGHGDDSSWDSPHIVSALEPRRLGGNQVVAVCCGGHHSGATTDSGKVFMWGLNRGGQCGQSIKSDSVLEPRPIESTELGAQKVEQLICGRSHSAVITTSGRLYTWGESGFGRLGVVDVQKFQSSPKEVVTFHNQPVQMVAAGDFHMLALTKDGLVYAWGCGVDGQTGLGTVLNVRAPRRVEYFDALGVVSITCGASWSMAITSSGHLFAWGCGDGGWLGIRVPPRLERLEPDNLSAAQASQIVDKTQFRCFDSQFNILVPQRVRFLSDWKVSYVRGGPGHALVMCTSRDEHGAGVSKSEMQQNVTQASDRKGTNKSIPNAVGAKGILHHADSKLSSAEIESNSRTDFKSSASTTTTDFNQHSKGSQSCSGRDSFSTSNQEYFSTTVVTSQLFGWCRHRKVDELQAAIEGGADVNVQDAAGNTPLIIACQNGYVQVCKLLVSSGAALNTANAKGNTALHYCLNYGYEDIGKYLIDCGADEFLTNNEGLTCYEGLTHSDLDLL